MSEANLRRYADATRSTVAPTFTAAVFEKIGLDRYVRAWSPIGEVFVAWNEVGVCAVRRAGDDEEFERWYGERFARRCVPAFEEDPVSLAARERLRTGEGDVPLDLRSCSPFERRVLERAAQIGEGHARPYALIAGELGDPHATRAVGNALGRNPVPLLIPCHRVVRADYRVGGYVFGSAAKRALLEHEGLDLEAVHDVIRHGFRYIGLSDRWFCLPTCGDIATRWKAPNHRGIHSLEEARACGLKPCGLCRPIAA
jgi:O-6-methylguanine DNA methyltransferase